MGVNVTQIFREPVAALKGIVIFVYKYYCFNQSDFVYQIYFIFAKIKKIQFYIESAKTFQMPLLVI